jgi:hypothetical protein
MAHEMKSSSERVARKVTLGRTMSKRGRREGERGSQVEIAGLALGLGVVGRRGVL